MLFPRKYHERVIVGSSSKEDGESKTYQASHLDAQTVTLNSQGDANLLGSQVKGNTVNANVGGKLNIESLQDEERFKTKSSGGGLEVEFGFGNNWSVSGYGNASKGTTYRKQVNEQAGIFAEEGGYHINADSVHLKGGAIASTNAQNSLLQTNTLTFEDIQNESSSKAASASISGSIKESKEKWVDNETGEKVKPHSPNSTFIPSQRSGGLSPGLPMLQQSSDSSTTKATLTEGTIILNKDTSPTQTTAAQLGINTDLAQANNQVAQTKDVKAQLQEQQQIATAIGHVQKAVETYTNNLYEEAKQQEREAKIAFEQGKISAEKYREAVVNTENWEIGGKYKQATDAITAVVALAVAGKPTETVATAGLSPYLNSAIKEITKDIPELNIPAHMLWGAVESQLMGGGALSGALSVGAGEAAAHYLAKEVYQKNIRELSEDEKRNISALSQLTAAITSGLTSAVGNENATTIVSNLSIDTVTTKNAVENNFVKPAVTGAKVIYKAAKARMKNGRLSAADLKKTLKEEGLDIADNLYTLFDGELSWDDVLAVVDLAVGTELNTANKGKAAEAIEELNDQISKKLIKKVDGYYEKKVDLSISKELKSLNKLEANTKYKLSNGHEYRTDNLGRIDEAKGELIFDTAARNQYRQRLAGGECRLKTDCGGHLIASMFNGIGESANLVPMDKILNGSGGKWYKMEMEWAKALDSGKKVEVNIKPIYSGSSKRPDSFEVSYSVDGKLTRMPTIKNTPTGE